jgi:hypothetical protein
MRKDAYDQYLISATEAVTCSLLDDGQWVMTSESV